MRLAFVEVLKSGQGKKCNQASPATQARFVLGPIRHAITYLRNVVRAPGVVLIRRASLQKNRAPLYYRDLSLAYPCINAHKSSTSIASPTFVFATLRCTAVTRHGFRSKPTINWCSGQLRRRAKSSLRRHRQRRNSEPCRKRCRYVRRSTLGLARLGVKEQPGVPGGAEVEHAIDRPAPDIERTLPDARAVQPVVFDEAQD